MTTEDLAQSAVSRAEARKALADQRSSDAAKVMTEVANAKEAELAKTARLRALRLAKEEADRAIVPVKRVATRSGQAKPRKGAA